jgi:hypothetical protein
MSNIVANTGINYTLYYNVLNFFGDILNEHPSINQVSLGDITEFDNREFPQYPIGNVNITQTTFGPSVTNFQIQIIVADKVKNKNDESIGQKNLQTIPFFGIDDLPDIQANTLAIINDVTAYTQRGLTNFEIIPAIVCQPFTDKFMNGLAGWTTTFTLTTHNDKNRCLYDLYP